MKAGPLLPMHTIPWLEKGVRGEKETIRHVSILLHPYVRKLSLRRRVVSIRLRLMNLESVAVRYGVQFMIPFEPAHSVSLHLS